MYRTHHKHVKSLLFKFTAFIWRMLIINTVNFFVNTDSDTPRIKSGWTITQKSTIQLSCQENSLHLDIWSAVRIHHGMRITLWRFDEAYLFYISMSTTTNSVRSSPRTLNENQHASPHTHTHTHTHTVFVLWCQYVWLTEFTSSRT
jgi:hypothetical protein